MTKSEVIRNDILEALKFSRQLEAMEHFLNQQFNNIKQDEEAIRKYIIEATAVLDKINKNL